MAAPAVDLAAANAVLAANGIVFRFTKKKKSPSARDRLAIAKLTSPEQWFQRTRPLVSEMTPSLARAANRLFESAMAPTTSNMSPQSCMEALRCVEATLKRRRSARIEIQEAERAAAEQAAKEAAGAARRDFKLAIANRPVKRSRFVDKFGRAHVF